MIDIIKNTIIITINKKCTNKNDKAIGMNIIVCKVLINQ